jgi:hypothetical protein
MASVVQHRSSVSVREAVGDVDGHVGLRRRRGRLDLRTGDRGCAGRYECSVGQGVILVRRARHCILG